MNFLVGLRQTQKQYDSIWVVVDRLIKTAHYIFVKSTLSAEDNAEIFVNEILAPRYSVIYHIILECTIHI